MKRIKLIQIGDIHYPDIKKSKKFIDEKDGGFDSSFVSSVAPSPFYSVGYALVERLERSEIDGVLFSGDMTSFANEDSYKECVEYFDEILQKTKDHTGKDVVVHVVPGNHDLKRKGITSPSIDERFGFFKKVWADIGRDILPVETIRSEAIENGLNKVNVYSLNTCYGCGEEYRKFPQEIIDVYEKLIEEADLDDKDQFEKFCENLDTPSIHKSHLEEIEKLISRSSHSDLDLVLAHHALLPQPIVRISPYSEVINGGRTRQILSTLNKPVIYCHGHIHSDLVEIVKQPSANDSSLVLISAPQYIDGFNEIEIVYTERNYPIGIVIHRYRMENHGSVRLQNSVNIHIRHPENFLNFCNPKSENVYSLLTGVGYIRIKDLLDLYNKKYESVGEEEMKDMVEELEWLQVVKITNKSIPSKSWSIGRVGL